jgi:hypothetical protein
MPCKLFLAGDSEPVWLDDPADVVLMRMSEAVLEADGHELVFVRLNMAPVVDGGQRRPAYIKPSQVQAVLPFHDGEYEHALDDPPDWAGE